MRKIKKLKKNRKQKNASKTKPTISGAWRIPGIDELPKTGIKRALVERIKELNCLYGIAQLAMQELDSIDQLLMGIVEIIPSSWQFPEITCSRICFKEKTFTSQNFHITQWRQNAQIFLYDEPIGEVAVFYLEERPAMHEGPFLLEERILLNAIAKHIGISAKRMAAEEELKEINRQLSMERKSLQETNMAFHTVLAKIEEEKRTINKNVQANIDKVIMPIIDTLRIEVPEAQKDYVELLRRNLAEITSPFMNRLSKKFCSLTPTEISVCNMIQRGLRSKEIADLRGVSKATISRHRERIRRKLNITNSDTNLATYLQSIS